MGGMGEKSRGVESWWSRYENETISMSDLVLTLVSTCHPREMPALLTRVQAIRKKKAQVSRGVCLRVSVCGYVCVERETGRRWPLRGLVAATRGCGCGCRALVVVVWGMARMDLGSGGGDGV